ncbi:unnamed protein product [Arctogadus glacialis]
MECGPWGKTPGALVGQECSKTVSITPALRRTEPKEQGPAPKLQCIYHALFGLNYEVMSHTGRSLGRCEVVLDDAANTSG